MNVQLPRQTLSANLPVITSQQRKREQLESSVLHSDGLCSTGLSTFEVSYGSRPNNVLKINNIYAAERFTNQDMEGHKSLTLPNMRFPTVSRSLPALHLKQSNISFVMSSTSSDNVGSLYRKDFNKNSYPKPFVYPAIRDAGVLPSSTDRFPEYSSTRTNYVSYHDALTLKREADQLAQKNSNTFNNATHRIGTDNDFHPGQSESASNYHWKNGCPAVRIEHPKVDFFTQTDYEDSRNERVSEAANSYRLYPAQSNENYHVGKQRKADSWSTHFDFGSDEDHWRSQKSAKAQDDELYVSSNVSKFQNEQKRKHIKLLPPVNQHRRHEFFKLKSIMHSDYVNPRHVMCSE